MSGFVQHTRTFKKYTEEFQVDMVEAVRAYCQGREDLPLYEDDSIVKITGTAAAIEEMCTNLRARFGALPGDPEPKEDKKQKKD